MKNLNILVSLAICLLFSCKDPITVPKLPTFSDGLISNEKGEVDLLKAIGQYDGDTRCTAVFVRLSDNENASAYVLTNGHCAQDWNPNAVNIDKAIDHKVYFNVFKNTAGFAPPELSDYIYKVGHPDSVSTTNTKDYNRYRRIPFEVSKGKPQKLVVIGFDVAGNATKPYVKSFP